MASYDDDRRSRYKSDRDRRRDDYDDMAYDNRDSKSTTIVRRRDESVSSVEEVTRDFPPGERGAVYRETTVRKSGHRPVGSRSKSYEDDYDYYDDRSSYSRRSRRGPRDDETYVSRRSSRRYDDRGEQISSLSQDETNFRVDGRRRRDSYSDYSSRSPSPRPKKDKERRKSTTEEVLKSIGLGGVAGAILGKSKDKSRSRSRSRDRNRSRGRGRSSSSSRSRSREKGKKSGKEKGAEALKAALLAGVVEAVRARKEPGGWGGDKGKRVLTAAVAAGGVDGILSHNRSGDHSTRDVLGSAVAGLATNRIVNGARSKSRGPADDRGRRPGSPDDRGRSPSRGGIGDIAAGGTLAATGKKLYDRMRSKSRGRAKSRDSSYDSYDSRNPSRPKPERKRSSSVSAAVAKGLGAIGLGSAADKIDPSRRQNDKDSRDHRDYDDRGYDDRSRGYDDRSRGYYDDASNNGYNYNNGYQNGYNNGNRDPRDRDVGALTPAAAAGGVVGAPRAVSTSRVPQQPYKAIDTAPRHTGDPETDSDSDLGSSSGEEKIIKKSRKKTILTGALASVATIHAGHSIYQSMEKRDARRKALKEGDISQGEAKREKNRARLQDAASVGIAALGIKGAYSEWQSLRNENKETAEKKEAAERHKAKREARRRKDQMLAAQAYREGGYTGSMPNLGATDSPYYGSDAGYYAPHHQPQSAGPVHYSDGNPYSSYAAPAPQQPHPQQYATPPPGPPQYNPQYPDAGYQHPYDIPPPPMGPPRADTR